MNRAELVESRRKWNDKFIEVEIPGIPPPRMHQITNAPGGGCQARQEAAMQIHLVTSPLQSIAGDWLLVGILEATELSKSVRDLDGILGGRIARLREAGDLTGKHAELLAIRDAHPLEAKRLLLIGLGKPAELTAPRFEKACLTALRHVTEKKLPSVAFAVPDDAYGLSAAETVQAITIAASVAGVGQGTFKTEPARFAIEDLTIAVAQSAKAAEVEAASRRGQILGENFRQAGQRTLSGLRPELRRVRRPASQSGTHGSHARRRAGQRSPPANGRARIRRRR
jgi:hypothetical protein